MSVPVPAPVLGFGSIGKYISCSTNHPLPFGAGAGASASASASASACALFCVRPTQRMANFRYGPIDTDSDSDPDAGVHGTDSDSDPDAGVQGSNPWTQARINKVHALAWEATSCPRHVARIERALCAGFPVNSLGKSGYGILTGAVARGHVPIVQLLLRAGADPNNNPESALFPASVSRQHGAAMVEMLVAAGAHVDARKSSGMPYLHKAARRGNLSAVKVLDARRRTGKTPLCEAVKRGNLPVVKALVAAGADVNATHFVPRMSAQRYVPFNVLRDCWSHNSVLDFLVSLPQLDLDTKNSDGFTPEAQARDDGRHDVANTLAAVSAVRAARWTPLRSAWVAAVTTAAAAAAAAASTRSSLKRQREEST